MHAINQERNRIDIDSDSWFHYWHAHDWNCEGNGYADLEAHIREIGSIFDYVARKAEKLQGGFQIWIRLEPSDPLQDAVYLHAPNPHSDFPEDFSDVQWDVEIPEVYRELAAGRRFGCRLHEGCKTYIVMHLKEGAASGDG